MRGAGPARVGEGVRVVALDGSTWWIGVALLEGERGALPRVVGELGFAARGSHATFLLQAIEHLLSLAGWERDGLDGYVATCGPGSFTGIRVALGTIGGLGLAAGRPCAAVTTLDALAQAARPALAGRRVLAAIAAGRGEFYGALYDADSEPPAPVEGPWVYGAERLVAEAGASGTVVVPGYGTETVLRELGLDARVRLVPPPRGVAAAAGSIALGRDALQGPALAPLAPLYLRPPDAEIKGRGH